MKQLTERQRVHASDAWGRPSAADHQHFEVEPQDVGDIRHHYLGYNHASYTFTRSDIGRKINVMTDGTYWTCWSFIS